jgi:hypothetical protein
MQENHDLFPEATQETSWAYQCFVMREDQLLATIQRAAAWDEKDAAAKVVVLYECGIVDVSWNKYQELREVADQAFDVASALLGRMTVWRRIEDGWVSSDNIRSIAGRF